jgi:hypothetical protein
MEGELGKKSKKESASDDLKVRPILFPLTLNYHSQACHALGGFTQQPQNVHTQDFMVHAFPQQPHSLYLMPTLQVQEKYCVYTAVPKPHIATRKHVQHMS